MLTFWMVSGQSKVRSDRGGWSDEEEEEEEESGDEGAGKGLSFAGMTCAEHGRSYPIAAKLEHRGRRRGAKLPRG